MSVISTDIGNILQELMKVKGLSISEVARRTKIPQPTLYRIANGIHNRPHRKTLEALAKFFEVTIDQLFGLDLINWISSNSSKVPLIPSKVAAQYLNALRKSDTYISIDRKISEKSFAIKMPDSSMEPLIQKDSILIIDPEKEPTYKSIVAVKLKTHADVIIRQLILNAHQYYVRGVSQDLENFNMFLLNSEDLILGTVIEVRFYMDK